MQLTSSLKDSSGVQKIQAGTLFSAPGFSSLILSKLQNEGFVIISNLNLPVSCRGQALEDFVRLMGDPVLHALSDTSFICDIKKKVEITSAFPTYSEHSEEAFLHTDSAYKETPEDAFILYCIKPAACQGGMTTILSLSDIYNEMAAHPCSQLLLRELANTRYPYMVPSIFKTRRDVVDEFIHEPILEPSQKIRFRRDTIQKSLSRIASTLSEDAIAAFELFTSLIKNSQKTLKVNLAAGDLLVMNNRTMLHGRTAFNDSTRHLLRIRFNIKDTEPLLQPSEFCSHLESNFLDKYLR